MWETDRWRYERAAVRWLEGFIEERRALVVAATASRTAARPTVAAACGSDYWPLKTFSDPLRKKATLTWTSRYKRGQILVRRWLSSNVLGPLAAIFALVRKRKECLAS
jgi:hypothetical protein